MTNETNAVKEIKIPALGERVWSLFIHESDATVPADATDWFRPSQKLQSSKSIGRLVGAVKRHARHNGGEATWHIVPFNSVVDGEQFWTLQIS